MRRRQASEKRQGTKSRLVGRLRGSGLYGDLTAAGIVGMLDWTGRSARDLLWQGGRGWLDERKGRRAVAWRLL